MALLENPYYSEHTGKEFDEAVEKSKEVIDVNEAVKKNTEDISQLALKVAEILGITSIVEEGGFHVADKEGNVCLRYNEDGLDAEKLTQHLLNIIKNGIGGGGEGGKDDRIVDVNEDGFFFADSNYNVGVKIDNDGIHAKNVFEFKLV